MSQRFEPPDSLDDFPTPPWATRALLEHVIAYAGSFQRMSCLEPACGAGYMARPLQECFGTVRAADIYPYGFGRVADFLTAPIDANSVDWVITNPPFRLAEEFIKRALSAAKRGVAILTRTVFIESVGRHQELFEPTPPTMLAQFAERVPMVKGRLDPEATTATAYAWIVWDKDAKGPTRLTWVPPCRKKLERTQ
jgi:hypothetical protein